MGEKQLREFETILLPEGDLELGASLSVLNCRERSVGRG